MEWKVILADILRRKSRDHSARILAKIGLMITIGLASKRAACEQREGNE